MWQLKLPKLGSESNIRLVNITKDAHLDIIMGFGTGADGYDVPEFVCDIYFNGQVPCFGGMYFLNLCLLHVIWTERQMSKLVLNVKYLLLLSFLTATEFYNLGHIQGVIRVH